jgi:hypothetical protein
MEVKMTKIRLMCKAGGESGMKKERKAEKSLSF